jgi:hypothetical protein
MDETIADGAEGEEEESQDIHVDVTEDGLVWVQGEDWELVLTPEESRLLGQALLDAATDAEDAEE